MPSCTLIHLLEVFSVRLLGGLYISGEFFGCLLLYFPDKTYTCPFVSYTSCHRRVRLKPQLREKLHEELSAQVHYVMSFLRVQMRKMRF